MTELYLVEIGDFKQLMSKEQVCYVKNHCRSKYDPQFFEREFRISTLILDNCKTTIEQAQQVYEYKIENLVEQHIGHDIGELVVRHLKKYSTDLDYQTQVHLTRKYKNSIRNVLCLNDLDYDKDPIDCDFIYETKISNHNYLVYKTETYKVVKAKFENLLGYVPNIIKSRLYYDLDDAGLIYSYNNNNNVMVILNPENVKFVDFENDYLLADNGLIYIAHHGICYPPLEGYHDVIQIEYPRQKILIVLTKDGVITYGDGSYSLASHKIIYFVAQIDNRFRLMVLTENGQVYDNDEDVNILQLIDLPFKVIMIAQVCNIQYVLTDTLEVYELYQKQPRLIPDMTGAITIFKKGKFLVVIMNENNIIIRDSEGRIEYHSL